MANILAYSFTSGGYTYDVYVEDTLLYVFVETDNPTVIDEVPSADINPPGLGNSAYSFCVGTTKYDVIADVLFPFGYLEVEENSLTCGYTPVVCDLTVSASVTHETSFEAADGTVTATGASSNTPIQYSLDGVTFQTSPEFTNLAPGSYTMYAKDAAGCTASAEFIINAASASTIVVPFYPWQDQPCNFFKLNGVLVSEPIKWDNINWVGERDKTFHGWNYQFTDEVVDLEFDVDAGYYIIDAEYKTKGSDGTVVLQYGYRDEGVDYILFTGKLNLNTLKAYPHKYACSVERYDGNSLVETRIGTKVSLTSAAGLDGATITPPLVETFELHGKEIKKRYDNADTTGKEYVISNGSTTVGYTVPDNTVVNLNELETVYNYPMFHSPTSPVDDLKYFLDAKFAGTYTFRVKVGLIMQYRSTVIGGYYANGSGQWCVNVNGTENFIGPTFSMALTNPATAPTIFNVDATFSTDLNVGDKVYIYIKHTFTGGATGGSPPRKWWIVNASQTYNETTVDALEQAAPTECKGWWLFDTVDHVTKVITNGQSKLKSSFLRRVPTPGQGSLHVLTNGYQIRQYETATRPMQVSLKTLLDSLRAMFCIGVQYDDTEMRIERVDYFYQDREILYIDEVSDLVKEVARDLLFNELEVGYTDYQKEGYNTLDEFNTKQEWATPIQTNKAKLPILSDLIASGYSIETIRRKQFATTATEATADDDKVYIISMLKDGTVYRPEKNEPFDTVTGMISPETAYNLRLSPKRMLYNWAIWLKNVFAFKPDTAVIRNTFFAQNGDLTTDLSVLDTRPVGDIDKQPLTEKEDVTLVDFPVARPLFTPEYIKFKCKLTPDQVEMVNRALKGKHTPDKNYGYVRYNDPTEGFVAGWPYKMEYNFYTEQAEFTLLRKA